MIELLKPLKDQARFALRRATGEDPHTQSQATMPDGAAARLAALGRPSCETTKERMARDTLFAQGRDLARQDRWDTLSDLLRTADAMRALTPGVESETEIISVGARADLSRALYSASEAGALAPRNEMLAGLEALDEVARERHDDPFCAAVVALTHMDAGWAWYKQGWQRGRPEQHVARFRVAFDRAGDLLHPLSQSVETSPLLASVRCALLAGHQNADRHVTDRYETLISLAPDTPSHMRAYGLHLLPCWFGSYKLLDAQARRTADLTQQHWGKGGYAWVYLDALLQDHGCFARLDGRLFLDALEDIVDRVPAQHMVNLIAASVSGMLARRGDAGPDRAMRRALTERRDFLIREKMTETHAWTWSILDTSYATPGAGHMTRGNGFGDGMAAALGVVSQVLSRDLWRGSRPVATVR